MTPYGVIGWERVKADTSYKLTNTKFKVEAVTCIHIIPSGAILQDVEVLQKT